MRRENEERRGGEKRGEKKVLHRDKSRKADSGMSFSGGGIRACLNAQRKFFHILPEHYNPFLSRAFEAFYSDCEPQPSLQLAQNPSLIWSFTFNGIKI